MCLSSFIHSEVTSFRYIFDLYNAEMIHFKHSGQERKNILNEATSLSENEQQKMPHKD